MESLANHTTSSCILCKVITINDEEDDNKPKEKADEDVKFLFKILLEIPPNPGISLVVDGNLINCDHLLLLESKLVWWCDQCNVTIQQARKLYQQISAATQKFRKIQRKIVETIQKCITNDNSAFNEEENYKAIWRKLCLHNEGRFNKFEYPFIVQQFKSPLPPRPPKVAVTVAKERKGSQDQTQPSSCHGDNENQSEVELICKNEEDVKEETVEDDEQVKQQRILLIFPENYEDKDDHNQNTDNLPSSSSSNSASNDDDNKDEIIRNLKADAKFEEDDPLAEDIKEEPKFKTDKSQENVKKPKQNYCTICKKTYSRKEYLIFHNKRFHSSKSTNLKYTRSSNPSNHHKCLDPQCQNSYKTFSNLRQHLKKCHPQIPVPTQFKPSNFHIKYPELYSKIVRNPDTNLFMCPYSTDDPPCPKSSKWKTTLEKHIKSKHLNDRGNYPCSWGQGCTRTFAVWTNYQAHMDRHKGTPKYKCDQCDKQFYSKNPLISHKQREHEDGKNNKPFNCQICGKSFSCRDYLYIHKSTSCNKLSGKTSVRKNQSAKKIQNKNKVKRDKTPGSSRPQLKKKLRLKECQICGKFVSNLKLHIEYSHSTERKHMCHLCPESFKCGPHLKLHLKRHEDPNGAPGVPFQQKMKFQCSVKGCRLRFTRKELLDSHMKRRHGEDGEKEPALKCQYCGKGFHLSKNLKLHEESHENEGKDPYGCEICGKGFRTMTYLKYHQKHTHKMKLEDGRKVSKR